jgi:hypothetical protein
VNPEIEFLLGPGWKIIVGAFAWGVLYAQQRSNGEGVKSLRKAIFGENGDGPIIVTNKTCQEREAWLGKRIDDVKLSVEKVDTKVDGLIARVDDVDGRLLVVESQHPS